MHAIGEEAVVNVADGLEPIALGGGADQAMTGAIAIPVGVEAAGQERAEGGGGVGLAGVVPDDGVVIQIEGAGGVEVQAGEVEGLAAAGEGGLAGVVDVQGGQVLGDVEADAGGIGEAEDQGGAGQAGIFAEGVGEVGEGEAIVAALAMDQERREGGGGDGVAGAIDG